MSENPLKEGAVIEHSAGIGRVSRRMVRERAAELAIIGGRSLHEVTKSDWDQARRELTGGSELDASETAIEAVPESERWDPVHGSLGQKIPPTGSEDEDDEGRSDQQRLVEEGVREAEHDQMLEAARQPPAP